MGRVIFGTPDELSSGKSASDEPVPKPKSNGGQATARRIQKPEAHLPPEYVDRCISGLLAQPKASQLINDVDKYFRTVIENDRHSPLAQFASEDVPEIDAVMVYLIKRQNRLIELGALVNSIDDRIGLNGLGKQVVLERIVLPSIRRIVDRLQATKNGAGKFVLHKGRESDIATVKVAINK